MNLCGTKFHLQFVYTISWLGGPEMVRFHLPALAHKSNEIEKRVKNFAINGDN